MASFGDYLSKAYINGEFVNYAEANIPISSSVIQYGIGCFAGVRGYKQADGSIGIFRLQDHAERLVRGASLLNFDFKMTADEVAEVICELVRQTKPSSDIYLRPIIYKSDTILGPSLQGNYDLAVYGLEIGEYLDTSNGLSVGVSSWARVPDNAIPARAKATGVYLNAALAIDEARQNGFDGSIMLDTKGDVTEGAVMNLFLVKNDKLITPEIGGDLLEGITRRTVIEQAQTAGLEVIERTVSRSELYNSDEAFFTGTATEIAWIKSIDNRIVSEKVGPISQKMKQAFRDIVTLKHEESSRYLDVVEV